MHCFTWNIHEKLRLVRYGLPMNMIHIHLHILTTRPQMFKAQSLIPWLLIKRAFINRKRTSQLDGLSNIKYHRPSEHCVYILLCPCRTSTYELCLTFLHRWAEYRTGAQSSWINSLRSHLWNKSHRQSPARFRSLIRCLLSQIVYKYKLTLSFIIIKIEVILPSKRKSKTFATRRDTIFSCNIRLN